jgi:hypothetical protein
LEQLSDVKYKDKMQQHLKLLKILCGLKPGGHKIDGNNFPKVFDRDVFENPPLKAVSSFMIPSSLFPTLMIA